MTKSGAVILRKQLSSLLFSPSFLLPPHFTLPCLPSLFFFYPLPFLHLFPSSTPSSPFLFYVIFFSVSLPVSVSLFELIINFTFQRTLISVSVELIVTLTPFAQKKTYHDFERLPLSSYSLLSQRLDWLSATSSISILTPSSLFPCSMK